MLSLRTKNYYARAIKQLIRWMVHERRIAFDPLAQLRMQRVETDIRHDRRAISDVEFRKLIRSAESSEKVIEGFTGLDRASLYTVARLTGLRRAELASLTPESFVLKRRDPYLVVEAAYSKHREQDVIPLHPDLIPLIEDHVSALKKGSPLFPLLAQRKTSKMIRHDLLNAGISYKDDDGRFADFHSLRHSFISRTWESGASPDVVMALARHKTLAMTMRYTHTDQSAKVRAIRSMPSPLSDGDD